MEVHSLLFTVGGLIQFHTLVHEMFVSGTYPGGLMLQIFQKLKTDAEKLNLLHILIQSKRQTQNFKCIILLLLKVRK